jgi:hypothetical protein
LAGHDSVVPPDKSSDIDAYPHIGCKYLEIRINILFGMLSP